MERPVPTTEKDEALRQALADMKAHDEYVRAQPRRSKAKTKAQRAARRRNR